MALAESERIDQLLTKDAGNIVTAALFVKDYETKKHSERVAKYSREIAIRYGLTEEAEIIKNVIKTKNQFIEYVAFILGDDYVRSFLENKKTSGEYGEWDQNSAMPAVYEKMLKTSISDPDRLGEIQYITKAIEEEEIIPPEFREMYAVFCDTLGIKQV